MEERKTIRTSSSYVINTIVEGFAGKCCATKICNLARQGCNRHAVDCFLSDREISETLLSITISHPPIKEITLISWSFPLIRFAR